MRDQRSRLHLEDLEARDVPAQWYSVTLTGPAEGTHGSSDLAVAAGGLANTAEVDSDGTVWAETPGDAVRIALGGSVTVGRQTYELRASTLADDPTEYAPFLLVPTAGGFEIRLEDLARTPEMSDWDYNDTTWGVSVAEFAAPPGANPKPAPAGFSAIKVELDPDLIGHIKTAKIDDRVERGTEDTIRINVGGGHVDNSLPKTVKVKIGAGTTAEREVTITLTPKDVDPKVDRKTKPHEVIAEGTVSDPGPPANATPEDKAKFPKVTKVGPFEGKATNVTKTHFPTDWDEEKIKAAIPRAAILARANGMDPAWKPDPAPAKTGRFEFEVDGVLIRGRYEMKGNTIVVTQAFPVVTTPK